MVAAFFAERTFFFSMPHDSEWYIYLDREISLECQKMQLACHIGKVQLRKRDKNWFIHPKRGARRNNFDRGPPTVIMTTGTGLD